MNAPQESVSNDKYKSVKRWRTTHQYQYNAYARNYMRENYKTKYAKKQNENKMKKYYWNKAVTS